MPKISSIYVTFHDALDLIHALQNPAPANPLSKLVNYYTEALRTLAEIFSKTSPPVIPLRMPVRAIVQDKPTEVTQ